MRKIFFIILISCANFAFAQFNITIKSAGSSTAQEAYFYTIEGSKEVLIGKALNMSGIWQLRHPQAYAGMMKAYFPDLNYSLSFISENKDVEIALNFSGNKVSQVSYIDKANQEMNKVQNIGQKVDNILPALKQIQAFYTPQDDFYTALTKEISVLSKNSQVSSSFPFINYYQSNYKKFIADSETGNAASSEDIIQFFRNSGEYLESSSLMRPILIEYLGQTTKEGMGNAVENLLKAVDVESPRGQLILSELIDIFDVYALTDLKEHYLGYAQDLKCTITPRLKSTIEVNVKTSVGSNFEDYQFVSPINTVAKSLYQVKSKNKIIVFWSSTCSHCQTDLPKFIPKYKELKSRGIEIIGLSLDADRESYELMAQSYPWISDSELKGWRSSVNEKYNVNATPTYFILDEQNKIVSKPNTAMDALAYFGLK